MVSPNNTETVCSRPRVNPEAAMSVIARYLPLMDEGSLCIRPRPDSYELDIKGSGNLRLGIKEPDESSTADEWSFWERWRKGDLESWCPLDKFLQEIQPALLEELVIYNVATHPGESNIQVITWLVPPVQGEILSWIMPWDEEEYISKMQTILREDQHQRGGPDGLPFVLIPNITQAQH